MAVHHTLTTDQVVLAIVGATLGTIIIILVAVVFYLLRTRTSACTKPTATDEEKQSVLTKGPLLKGRSVISTVIAEEKPGFQQPRILDQNLAVPPKHKRISSITGRNSPFYQDNSASSSSYRSTTPTHRGSIQDRRTGRSGSVSSLTLSLQSDASQVSIPPVAKAQLAAIPAVRSPSSSRGAQEQKILNEASKHLTVQELESLVSSLGQLSKEFMSLPTNHQDRADIKNMDKQKNRHPTVLPNNHSRIRLSGNKFRSESSAYINANFVRGFKRDQEFIATQGPLPSTVEDFWWMIWQENVSIVVMLTQIRERNKTVCEKYWPITNATYGDIVVTCEYSPAQKSKYQFNGFLIAEIESANQRRVSQYWYSDWPDKGAPEDASSLFAMMEEIAMVQREQQTKSSGDAASPNPPGPILVHCSAGIGRTGCYIALNSAIDQFDSEGKIDILGTVARIRLDRGGMVQTVEQYEFIHKALLQYIRQRESKSTKKQFFSTSEKDEELEQ